MKLDAKQWQEHLRESAALAGLTVPEIVLAEDRYVPVNGLRLHYLDWGSIDRQPMVFLHGGALNAHTWDLICLAFRDQYHCLAVDLRGHGDSDWSPEANYSLDAYAGDLEAFVDTLGLGRGVLIGMSLGGAVAMRYAAWHSQRLDALVLVDIGPETREAGRRRIAEFVAGPAELDSIEAFVDRALAFNPRRRRDVLRRSLLHNLRPTPTGTWTWKYDPRRYEAQALEVWARTRPALWADVLKIECPTLVLRGAESEVFLDEDAQRLATALPRGTWIRIEKAGHTIQGDQPKALVEAIRSFLQGVVT